MESPPKATRPRRGKLLQAYVIIASVVLHVVLIPMWASWLTDPGEYELVPVEGRCSTEGEVRPDPDCCSNPLQCPQEDSTLEVVWVDEREEPEEPPEEVAEEEPPQFELPFVVTPPNPEEKLEVPDEASALGTLDTSTPEEMVAKGQGLGSGAGAARPSTAPRKVERSAKGEKTRNEERLDELFAEAAPAVEVPRPGPETDTGEGKAAETRESSSAESVENLETIVPDIYSEELLAASGGGSIDYLDGIEEGEKTLLNRKRSSYADFFERVKVGVSQHWDPVRVYRRRDPHGKVYGVQDRLTVLRVSLRGNGSIVELLVEESSGLDFMDDEALRAFKKAGPFPNPPEGLKGKDGLIRFSFGFYFEITTRKFRAFRYR